MERGKNMNTTKHNGDSWVDIYKNTGFGNKYPSSYFVSLFHSEIKHLFSGRDIIKVLDFGCSFGANSRMLFDSGRCDIYGIDISDVAIKYCINNNHLPASQFVCTDVLEEGIPFDEKFDLIVCSEVLLYFDNENIHKLMMLFIDSLREGGVLYASMPTTNHCLYCNHVYDENYDNMMKIPKSHTADGELFANPVVDKKDIESKMFPFKIISAYLTREERKEGLNEEIHYIGRI